jgi:CheY-like chemotaxis protein
MERDVVVGLITNTHPSFGELLQWILMAFNLESGSRDKVEMYKTFMDFLIEQYAANRRTVLIVDEAQNMGPQALEELRMLSNVNSEKDQVLQVILAGQPGLRDNLRDPRLEQFAQRISVDYNLEPLSQDETIEYIRHRLGVVGGSPDIFDSAACEGIFRYSGGIPRLVNLLCDTALVYGYAEQASRIDAAIIEDVARDKQQSKIVPLRHSAQDVLDDAPDRSPGKRNVGEPSSSRRAMRIAIASDSERQRNYLKMMLERSGLKVVAAVPVNEEIIDRLNREQVDVLLMDLGESSHRSDDLDRLIEQVQGQCRVPVLFNDSSSGDAGNAISDLGRKLTLKLTSLIGRG